MAQLEGYECDGCGKYGGVYNLYSHEKDVPNNWYLVSTDLWHHRWKHMYFCSKECLGKFADGKVREPVREKASVLFKKFLKALVGV